MRHVTTTRPAAFFLVLIVLFLTACGGRTANDSGTASSNLRILHFNDFHAQIPPMRVKWTSDMSWKKAPKAAGIARMVARIKALKTTNTLVLSAGDMLMGSAFSTVFKGRATFAIFNGLIDYMVIGNHEFDYNRKNLQDLIRIAGFRIFTSNIFTKDGKPYTRKRWYIRTINGIKVGLFGLTTVETPVTTSPKYVEGIRFLNEVKIAREMIKTLKGKGADIIIALTHIGLAADETLAKKVNGIDIIVGGHSHSLTNNYKLKNTWIAQAKSSGRYLGRIDISFNRKNKKIKAVRSLMIPMKKSLPQDTEALKKIAAYRKQLDGALQVVIGKTAALLDGMRSTVRFRESNLANFIADTIKSRTGADMVLLNGGGIRDSIQKGTIRVVDVLKVLPFNNTIVTMQLPGKLILKMFDKCASLGKGAGGMLHVSRGLKYSISGKKIKSVTFNGKPIDPDKTYTVATSSFLAIGGDGYSEFKKGTKVYDTGVSISDAVIKRIKQLGTISPKRDGRMKRD